MGGGISALLTATESKAEDKAFKVYLGGDKMLDYFKTGGKGESGV